MAGPHVDDKKSGSAYRVLRVTRIWMARATIYSVSDQGRQGEQGDQGEQGEQVAPNLFDCLIELPSCVSILLDRCCSVISDRLTVK